MQPKTIKSTNNNIFEKGRRPQFFEKGRRPQLLKTEEDLNFYKVRQPKQNSNRRLPRFFCNG